MTKAATSMPTKERHRKILKLAKGYVGRASTCYRVAKQKVEKGLQYAYRDRKRKKSVFRSDLWIVRINAALRERGLIYSKFINQLKKANITINRKMLAELALSNPITFTKLVEYVSSH